MNSISSSWDFEGKEIAPDAQMIRAAIDGIFREAGEFPLTADERDEISALFAELDEIVGGNYHD